MIRGKNGEWSLSAVEMDFLGFFDFLEEGGKFVKSQIICLIDDFTKCIFRNETILSINVS